MVVRVAEQAKRSGAERIIIATDCPEILDRVTCEGFEARLTRADHPSGTDRIAEIVMQLQAEPEQIIVNVQGDEPFIDPRLIGEVAQALDKDPSASVSTAASPIGDRELMGNPNIVKVVTSSRGHALYFSRAPIPFQRDLWPNLAAISAVKERPLAAGLMRHIGIYAYRASGLETFVTWPSCPIEQSEQLEQLRWLWNGHTIAVHPTAEMPHGGIDTPEDLVEARKYWASLKS